MLCNRLLLGENDRLIFCDTFVLFTRLSFHIDKNRFTSHNESTEIFISLLLVRRRKLVVSYLIFCWITQSKCLQFHFTQCSHSTARHISSRYLLIFLIWNATNIWKQRAADIWRRAGKKSKHEKFVGWKIVVWKYFDLSGGRRTKFASDCALMAVGVFSFVILEPFEAVSESHGSDLWRHRSFEIEK